MRRQEFRVWLMILLAVMALLLLVNPGWLLTILQAVQSIVMIALGIVATFYLWKRL